VKITLNINLKSESLITGKETKQDYYHNLHRYKLRHEWWCWIPLWTSWTRWSEFYM